MDILAPLLAKRIVFYHRGFNFHSSPFVFPTPSIMRREWRREKGYSQRVGQTTSGIRPN
ncbi:hypothetical protein IC582_023877 [Cucumis melo]